MGKGARRGGNQSHYALGVCYRCEIMKYLAALEYMLFREEVGKYRILSSSSMSSAYPHITVAIFEWLSCPCLTRYKKNQALSS